MYDFLDSLIHLAWVILVFVINFLYQNKKKQYDKLENDYIALQIKYDNLTINKANENILKADAE